MSKKEFTEPTAKRLNDLSDVELIEKLTRGNYLRVEEHAIKALLDLRLKRSIHDLTRVVRKNNEKTQKYNKWLIGLTITIAILTLLMLIGLGIQIWLLLK